MDLDGLEPREDRHFRGDVGVVEVRVLRPAHAPVEADRAVPVAEAHLGLLQASPEAVVQDDVAREREPQEPLGQVLADRDHRPVGGNEGALLGPIDQDAQVLDLTVEVLLPSEDAGRLGLVTAGRDERGRGEGERQGRGGALGRHHRPDLLTGLRPAPGTGASAGAPAEHGRVRAESTKLTKAARAKILRPSTDRGRRRDGMIAYATVSEMKRNIDEGLLCAEWRFVTRCWEYGWALRHGRFERGLKCLDAGCGQAPLLGKLSPLAAARPTASTTCRGRPRRTRATESPARLGSRLKPAASSTTTGRCSERRSRTTASIASRA